MGLLTKKCLVIIGGTSGLGFSAAKAFVRAGAKIVVVGRDQESADAARTALGKKAVVLVGEAMDPATAVRAIHQCRERFGAFHGLYHVAGGSGRRFGDGPLHEVTDEGIHVTLDWNLKSVIYSNRAAVCAFLDEKSGGSILNVGSVLGSAPSPAFFGTHVYAAAKAAIVGFSRSLASSYAPHDIRVNVLAPGLVETQMSQRATANETILKFLATKQPLDGGRVGQPADLDAAAVYFMSDASRFCTGQVLAVDGGWSISEGQVSGNS